MLTCRPSIDEVAPAVAEHPGAWHPEVESECRRRVSALARASSGRLEGLCVSSARGEAGRKSSLASPAGLHRNYVGSVERGAINPTLKTLLALVTGLQVPLSELIMASTNGSWRMPGDSPFAGQPELVALGVALRELRERRGVQQEAVGFDAGVGKGYVSAAELGRLTRPS